MPLDVWNTDFGSSGMIAPHLVLQTDNSLQNPSEQHNFQNPNFTFVQTDASLDILQCMNVRSACLLLQ